MNHDTGPEPPAAADFRLDGWLVEPSLNRVSSDERVVQLEPKLMDVLVFLASQAGRVVSKREITDAVWPDTFITESVITRSIAGLRRAFGDDVRDPRFIETISKRGYRLIADVASGATAAAGPDVAASTPVLTAAGGGRAALPYVVGQWVRGDTFYGRGTAVDEVLTGNRNWLWLLGTRRIGKTSMLKQLELIAATTPELGFLPVFWDLQGADRPEELHLDFADALLDAEEHLEGAGIAVADVRSEDCFDSMARLRRALVPKKLRLLLLCDEVEELIQLNEQDPSLLRKLRRALQSREGIRSVLASSNRLWRLADATEDTSPFLDGFTPPLTIGPLEPADARSLVLQERLAATSRPAFGEEDVGRICDLCGNHPYLIQMLCRHALQSGDVEAAVDTMHHDRAVAFFFSVDFELLNDNERLVLRHLASNPWATAESIATEPCEPSVVAGASLANLHQLGLVRKDASERFAVGNAFLRRWIEALQPTW
jgi:DNA-binding winged helix-turn-helix (wHTH) protein